MPRSSKRGGRQKTSSSHHSAYNALWNFCKNKVYFSIVVLTAVYLRVYFTNIIIDNYDLQTKPYQGEQFPVPNTFDPPLWSSLNGGHYFGLKSSHPKSIETSLVWFQNKLNTRGRLDLRHLCDQNDKLKTYGWTRHDFYTFGDQLIVDEPVKIRTSFVKEHETSDSWQAKISVDSVNTKSQIISLIQYITVKSQSDKIDIVSSKNFLKPSDSPNIRLLEAQGITEQDGKFIFRINLCSEPEKFIYGNFLRNYYDENLMTVSTHIHHNMLATKQNNTRLFILPGYHKLERSLYNDDENDDKPPNFLAYQLVLKTPASFRITFQKVLYEPTKLPDFDRMLEAKMDLFDKKFENTFKLDDEEFVNSTHIAKKALSNMLGGISYFFGDSYIRSRQIPNSTRTYGPIQLLAAVPSRSFFPRGFLWDDGFHNILISEWDSSISNKIIDSWFNIINRVGWMPREVILGIESLRRVPQEFIVQDINDANPPTMFLALEKMIDSNKMNLEILKKLYPKLKAWFQWLDSSQKGRLNTTYRWRGRDSASNTMLNPKTLTSGLDDYPRATHPSENEYHLDLRCWIALGARTLSKIAQRLNDKSVYNEMSQLSSMLHDNALLDELHWDEDAKQYCDYGDSVNKVELVSVTRMKNLPYGGRGPYRTMEMKSYGSPKFGCVKEFGYVSLFPLLLKIIDANNPRLEYILKRLKSEDELWSKCGVRSLSKQSSYYNKYNTEHDKPYWRGAIWINMNYLLVESLKHYSSIEGPFQELSRELYENLRSNLVNKVLAEYEKSGYFWENYNDENCKGQRSHPFTGWTALILLIMSSKF